MRPKCTLLDELAQDLGFGIATLRAREAHRRAEEMVARLAYFDSLTGLPNRMQLLERMDRVIAAARESGAHLALLTLNIDRFDDIQIGLGVGHGDEALRQLGERLGAAVGEGTFLARIGGDVFGVLVESGDMAGVRARRRSAPRRARRALPRGGHPAGRPGEHRRGALSRAGGRRRGAAAAQQHRLPAKRAGPATDSRSTRGRRTRRARASWRCWASCAAPSPPTSSSCTTSRRSTCARGPSWGPRRSCGGAIPAGA